MHTYDMLEYADGWTPQDELARHQSSLKYWTDLLSDLATILPRSLPARALFTTEVVCNADWQCDPEVYLDSLLHCALRPNCPFEFLPYLSEFLSSHGEDPAACWLEQVDWVPASRLQDSRSPFDRLISSSSLASPCQRQKLKYLLELAQPDVLQRNRLPRLLEWVEIDPSLVEVATGPLLDSAMKTHGLQPRQLGFMFATPLHGSGHNALFSVRIQCWHELLHDPLMTKLGVDINATSPSRARTLLHCAVTQSCASAVEKLLTLNPILTIQDAWNSTAIKLAAENIHLSESICVHLFSAARAAGIPRPQAPSLPDEARGNIAEHAFQGFLLRRGEANDLADAFVVDMLSLFYLDDLLAYAEVAAVQRHDVRCLAACLTFAQDMMNDFRACPLVLEPSNITHLVLAASAALRTTVSWSTLEKIRLQIKEKLPEWASFVPRG